MFVDEIEKTIAEYFIEWVASHLGPWGIQFYTWLYNSIFTVSFVAMASQCFSRISKNENDLFRAQ